MEIPSNVEVKVDGNKVAVKHGNSEAVYAFNSKLLSAKVEGGNLEFSLNFKGKRKLNAIKVAAEQRVKKLFAGVLNNFEKKLQVVYAHFPISVEVKGSGVLIKNFLGEKMPRKAAIFGRTQVKVAGQELTVSGPNLDDVGQTAANIVQATKIKEKDIRVFQDGIYLV